MICRKALVHVKCAEEFSNLTHFRSLFSNSFYFMAHGRKHKHIWGTSFEHTVGLEGSPQVCPCIRSGGTFLSYYKYIYIYIYIYIYKTLRSDCHIRVCILHPSYQSFLANVVMESSGCTQRMTETVNFGLILISVTVCGLRESLVN